jgi:hypothetical protein
MGLSFAMMASRLCPLVRLVSGLIRACSFWRLLGRTKRFSFPVLPRQNR